MSVWWTRVCSGTAVRVSHTLVQAFVVNSLFTVSIPIYSCLCSNWLHLVGVAAAAFLLVLFSLCCCFYHTQNTALTLSVWPLSVCSGTAVRVSHSLALPSCDAVARWCADCGCHAMPQIQSECEAHALTACAQHQAWA